MDLASLDTGPASEAGVEIALKHPISGEPIGAKLLLRGTDGETYQQILLEQRRARVKRLAQTGAERLDVEELEGEVLERLVASTAGWVDLELDGAPYPFSEPNARALYQRFRWVREQAIEGVANRANFLPRSASGS